MPRSASRPKANRSGAPRSRRRESRSLRERLAEAEQTVEAIRTGGVDALVVSGPDGEQIYTLQGADHAYRVLVETLQAGALTANLEGTILYANRYLADLLQLPLEQVLGREFPAFAIPEDRPLLMDLLTQTEAGAAAGELRLQPVHGPPVAVHLALRRLGAGDLPAVCVAVTDLTERKRIEAELRQLNVSLEARVRERTATLEAIFAGSPVALSLTSLETGRHLEVNDAWIRLFGYGRSEAVGRTVAGLGTWKHPETRDRLLADLRVAAGEPEAAHEVEFVTKAGAVFPGLLSWHPFELAGEPVVVAAIVDLTEAKRTERQLRAALAHEQEARATNAALLREVHHRVKNNLQMLCDLLYLQMEGMADEPSGAVLRDAYGRIYAMARLHDQLFGAMQGGQVRLGEYLAQLVSGLGCFYPSLPVRCEVPAEGVALDMDRTIHVGLIVNELATNALKHAFPSGGPGEVVVRLRQAGSDVEVQVRDNGVGLPADLDLAHAKTLGLRIVHILAQRLRATVEIESGRGAAFTLRFPLQADAPGAPATDGALAGPGRPSNEP